MLSYNDIKEKIELKVFDNNLWYAFYEGTINLSPGYLNKDNLIKELSGNDFQDKFKESVTKWIDCVFMTPYNQTTEIMVLEKLYKDGKVINVIDTEKNNRSSFNLAFTHHNYDLIDILINDKNIKHKNYEVHPGCEFVYVSGTYKDFIKNFSNIDKIAYVILENLYDENKCFSKVSSAKRNNYYRETLSLQMKQLSQEIDVGNDEAIKYRKNALTRIIKKLNVKSEKNNRAILTLGMQASAYNSLMLLYNDLDFKKKTLFVEKIKEIQNKSEDKADIEFFTELTRLYNKEKQYYELKKNSVKESDISYRIKPKKI